MSVSRDPANTPGSESGNVTRVNDSEMKNQPMTAPPIAQAAAQTGTGYSKMKPRTPPRKPPMTSPAMAPPGRHGPA